MQILNNTYSRNNCGIEQLVPQNKPYALKSESRHEKTNKAKVMNKLMT